MYMYILMHDDRKCTPVNLCIFFLFCRIIRNCCGSVYANSVCIVFIHHELTSPVKKWWETFLLIHTKITSQRILELLIIQINDSIIFIWGFQDCIWIDAFCFNYLWLFSGITRDNFDGKKVLRLEYEAYKPMAKKKMKEICDSIRKQWEIHNIAMIHRIK